MSGSYVSKELRRKVAEQAKHRCGYCLSPEFIVGFKMDIEHIIPEARGGLTVESNLWLSCSDCNGHKSDRIVGVDPLNGQAVNLFNPRIMLWNEHFRWAVAGDEVIGLTPIGRATVVTLNLNRPLLVNSRSLWVHAGWHPPRD